MTNELYKKETVDMVSHPEEKVKQQITVIMTLLQDDMIIRLHQRNMQKNSSEKQKGQR